MVKPVLLYVISLKVAERTDTIKGGLTVKGLAPARVSGILWGPWNISPTDKGRPL